MTSDLVSIIIPTYNRRDRLANCLSTVIGQSYSNFEVIVVDDGSSDDTDVMVNDLIKNKGLKDILFYYKIQNSGAPTARNYGLQKSKGEFIVFFDSDDLMLENRIEKQVSLMKDSAAQCCACGYFINHSGGKAYYPPALTPNFMRDYIKKILKGSTQSWMYRRELVEEVGGYDTSLKCYQDSDLTFRILLTNPKIVTSKEALSIFIDHSGNDRIMSNWGNLANIDSIIRYYHKMIGQFATSRNYELSVLSQKEFLKSVVPGFLNARSFQKISDQIPGYANIIASFPFVQRMMLQSLFLVNIGLESGKFLLKKSLNMSPR